MAEAKPNLKRLSRIQPQTQIAMESLFEKAVRLGQMPVGNVSPPVYLCGSCRSIQVSYEQPVCGPCTGKLQAEPYRMPWLGIAVMVAIGIAGLIGATFLVAR